jgi:hypothetical protein
MIEGWEDYFLLVGSAAAALIGLLFVVVTLTAGRELGAIERGQKLYMTPIVFSLGAIVLLSGIAMAPVATTALFAAVSAIIGLVGLTAQCRITIGLRKVAPDSTMTFDVIWYGAVPAVAYAAQLVLAALLLIRPGLWTLTASSAMVMVQLLVAIHNAWDLVTYLAPRTDKPNELR